MQAQPLVRRFDLFGSAARLIDEDGREYGITLFKRYIAQESGLWCTASHYDAHLEKYQTDHVGRTITTLAKLPHGTFVNIQDDDWYFLPENKCDTTCAPF